MTGNPVPTPPGLVPVSLLTGFLGSGKTTVLNALIRHPDAGRLAVIVNEFGEVGLDHDLIARGEEDTILLEGGCLCCTIKGKLADTLRRLHIRRAGGEVPAFDRVVIETTGLADPAPILQTLMADAVIGGQYTLDGVVATADAVNGLATLDRQVESAKQAAVADRILLTKTDIAPPATVEALEARLRGLNPAAPIRRVVMGAVAPGELFGAGVYDPSSKTADVRAWLNAEAYAPSHDHHDAHGHHGHAHDVNRHDDRIRAFAVAYDKPLRLEAIAAWLEMLSLTRGPDLLRIKGILNLVGEERPAVLHGVQQVFHPLVHLDAWPSEDRRSRLVFIARDVDPATLEASLRDFLDDPGGPAPDAAWA